MELLKNGFDKVNSDFQQALSSIDVLQETEIVLLYKKLNVAQEYNTILEGMAQPFLSLSIDNQVVYYKHLKPHIYKYIIFYEKAIHLHSRFPIGSLRLKRQHLNNYLKTLETFFLKNKDLIQYLRLNHVYNDAAIFTADSLQKEIASAFLACEMLEFYIHKLKQNLVKIFDEETKMVQRVPASKLTWTGSKTALIELIYALAYSGQLNDGKTGANAIAQVFEQVFCADLKDYRKRFQEIKIRKEPDKFLQMLSIGLKNGIDKQLEL